MVWWTMAGHMVRSSRIRRCMVWVFPKGQIEVCEGRDPMQMATQPVNMRNLGKLTATCLILPTPQTHKEGGLLIRLRETE